MSFGLSAQLYYQWYKRFYYCNMSLFRHGFDQNRTRLKLMYTEHYSQMVEENIRYGIQYTNTFSIFNPVRDTDNCPQIKSDEVNVHFQT